MSNSIDSESKEWQCARDTPFNRIVSDLLTSRQASLQNKSAINRNEILSADKLQEYENIAIRDKLTGVYNARYLARKLAKEVRRGKRYKRPFSLMLIALDNISQLTQTYGEELVEEIIKRLVETISTSIREVDIVGRLSANDFAVILPETDSSSAIIVGRRICEKIIGISIGSETNSEMLTISIGLVAFPTHARDENNLLALAFQNLKQAHRQGSNQVVCTAISSPNL